MIIKPKAKKYRVQRGASLGGASDMTSDESVQPNPEQTASIGQNQEGINQSIEEIRSEGLSGRQLRMAQRVAQKYGLKPTSDYDAVRLLRAKGIDPFQRTNMLKMAKRDAESDQPQLPQTTNPTKAGLPSTKVNTARVRNQEIQKIQQSIAKRRQRKLKFLLARLATFVLLPTLLTGLYYYFIATPMYATKSEFIIQKADMQGGGGLGGLLGGTGFATSQDSITVQSYLQSREAMLRLDQDHGFRDHFSDDNIDFLQRLDQGASNEAAYRLYKDHINISYDPTEGIVKMQVTSADPNISATYAKALIAYAEQQVDQLTSRVRDDQMHGAINSYKDAELQMLAAQEQVIKLKEKSNIISGDVAIALLTNKISALEQMLVQDELALEELLSNSRPNRAKVAPLKRKIASLENKIAGYYIDLTAGTESDESLARITSQLAVAQANLETRNLMMQAALQQLEAARIEANRQTRYLSMGVNPTLPDEAAYPRKFENTILAFLIFSGVYLMLSLTVSILREQVTS